MAAAIMTTETRILNLLGRTSLSDFTRATFPEYQESWHHAVLAEALDQVAEHKIRKLIVTMPPRRGKSQLVSRQFPSYLLGKYPDKDIIMATHTISLAEKMSRDIARITSSRSFKNVFPNFGWGSRNTLKERETSAGGLYQLAGVGSAIAGIGANWVIIDDYFGSRADAESEGKRERVWEWYLNDVSRRVNNPGAIIIVATRWHEDDLIGRLLVQEPGEWTVIEFPELLEVEPALGDPRTNDRELLWPEFFGLGEDVNLDECIARGLKAADDFKRLSPYAWSSLYQCRPSPREGGLFKQEWVTYYKQDPANIYKLASKVCISIDATFKKSIRADYVSMVVCAWHNDKIYVLDELNEKLDYPDTKQAAYNMLSKYPKANLLIEERANGSALLGDLRKNLQRVHSYDPGNESKESRAQVAADMFQGGSILLPSPAHAPWINDFVADFTGFGSRPHDDRVDALSQLCIRWSEDTDVLNHLRRILGKS